MDTPAETGTPDERLLYFDANPGFQFNCFQDWYTLYKAAICGTGGGKSYLGAAWAVTNHIHHPGTDTLGIEPTQSLLDEVMIPAITERLTMWGIEHSVDRKRYHINTPEYASKFILKSANTARTMTGFEVGRTWIDEPARIRRGICYPLDDVWENACQRTRDPAVPDAERFILCTGTHEGEGTWFYDLFEKNERLPKDKRNPKFKVYRGSSTENPLNAEHARRREKEMGADLAAQYVHGFAIGGDSFAIPPEVLDRAMHWECPSDWNPLALRGQRNLYVGIDIGRSKSLSVIWVLQKTGDLFKTVAVKVLERTAFHEQDKWFDQAASLDGVMKVGIDAGYNGQTAETLVRKHGSLIVPLYLNDKEKNSGVERMRKWMEQDRLWIPHDDEVMSDFRAVKRIVSASGAVKHVAPMSPDGHSDRFFACLCACAAAGDSAGPVEYVRGGMRPALERW